MNEESQPDVAISTKVHKVKVDDRFKDDALEKVRGVVKGNGIAPEEITLKSFEGELLHFEAYTDLQVTTKFSKKEQVGRITGPVNVANEVALQEAIAREYLSLFTDGDTQRKIRDIALKRDDQGFAAKDVVLKIPFWRKDFVIFDPCHTCRNTGKITCRPCAGKGMIPCNRCAGSGKCACSHCHGAQMVAGPNGKKVQCSVCYGQGRMGCNACQQTGKIQCRTCATKGATACPNCQGHGWISHLTIVDIEAQCKFDYPKDELPEKICAMIEAYGVKIREHAKIHLMEAKTNAMKVAQEEAPDPNTLEQKQKILHIPIFYEVSLPYGHIEFEIKGVSYYMFLFGIKGELSHVSPFLDDMIKNGRRKLQDAVEKRGDLSENLKAAAQYRVIRRALYYIAQHSQRKSAKLLERDFPYGLSAQMQGEVLEASDTALKMLSTRARGIGLGASAAAMLAMFCGYLLLPLRSALVEKLPLLSLQAMIDGVVVCGGVYCGAMIIQAVANQSVNTLLQQIIRSKNKIKVAAKLGQTQYWNMGVGAVMFVAAIEIALSLGGHIPAWYAMYRGG